MALQRPISAAILLACSVVLPRYAAAHALEDTECVEASDFIRNAALSRDNGFLEETFVERMRDDIAAIQSFPPQMRWVVQDDADAAMLIGAVQEAFRSSRSADDLRRQFLDSCRADSTAPSNAPTKAP